MKKENELLEEFRAKLVELCRKYNANIIHGDEDDGIRIEFILADDGYSKEYQDKIWSIGPDGIISEDD